MANEISGGCACGAVRYRSTATTEFTLHCHCRKCQRATGTGHAAIFALLAASVEIDGDIREYAAESDSGATTYAGFCPICGSPLTSRTERFPERLYFHAASLDNPDWYAPEFIVFKDAAPPWDPPLEL